MTKRVLLASMFALLTALPAGATPVNAALGKPVTITGDVGVITTLDFPNNTVLPPADLSTITDGAFLGEGTEWQTGTVWWDERHAGSVNNVIEIDLQGLYLISHLGIQADNNDAYQINYRDQFGVWQGCCYATTAGGAGMRTRAGNVGPFEASAFRIDAFAGDLYYSVSEFQATGELIPEPASLLLMGTGLVGIARRRLRRI